MKKLCAFAICLTIAGASFAQTAVKIGVVDSLKLFQQSQRIKTIDQSFQDMMEQKKGEIEPKRKAIEALGMEIKEKEQLLKEEELIAKKKELDQMIMEHQRLEESVRNEFTDKQNELMEPLYTELKEIITSMGQKEGYSIIIEKDALLYTSPQLDITDQVVKALDKNEKKAAPKAAPVK